MHGAVQEVVGDDPGILHNGIDDSHVHPLPLSHNSVAKRVDETLNRSRRPVLRQINHANGFLCSHFHFNGVVHNCLLVMSGML